MSYRYLLLVRFILINAVSAAIAGYLCGTHLVHLASALSDNTKSSKLEPMPLSNRRQR